MLKAGTPEKIDQEPDRHRPVLPGAVPEGRGDPLQGLPAVLGRQGQDRRPGLRDHARCVGALGQAAEGRVPRHALPEPGRPGRDPQGPERAGAGAGRPERRLPGLQRHRRSPSTTCACARPSTWRSTRRPSSTASTWAPASPPRTRSRRPCGRTTTRSRTTPTIRKAPRSCWRRPAYPDGFTTDLWAMPVQRPYNPNAKRIAELMQADLAKVGVKAEIKTFEWGEYRKRMQAGEHQMGMLGWTGDNGDPDNFLSHAARLRLGQDQRLQRGQVLLPALRGPGPEGQDRAPSRPSATRCTRRPR